MSYQPRHAVSRVNSRTRRVQAIALCAAVVAPLSPFIAGASGFTKMLPEAQAQTAPGPATPRDQVGIKVQADGTHNGPGTETFLNSANGYNPGDNTIDDGVVSSNDVVTYQVEVNIVAGPARTVHVEFSNEGDALELGDFSKLTMGDGAITTRASGKGIDVIVPRGATGKLSGTVTVRAKDTQGQTKSGNTVTATLTNGGQEVFKAKTKDVTVISAPMADLTVDTKLPPYRSYTQASAGGEFNIDPLALQPEGYSQNGLIASTEWKTDIDVSAFPAGTTWSMNDQNIPVQNGVLKDVTGIGSAVLKYVIPENAKPVNEEGKRSQRYEIKLNVNPDSFKVGNARNIADPGNGQPANYKTSTYTVNGKKVGALDGRLLPNNNYSAATWYYYEAPVDNAWIGYEVAAPVDATKTVFENENLYWNPGRPYNEQGMYFPSRFAVTSDNDLYDRIMLRPSKMNDTTNASEVTLLDELDTDTGANYRSHKYDVTRNAVVTLGGVAMDPAKFKVEYLVGSEWLESDAPIEGATKARFTFAKDAFPTGKAATSDLSAFVPVKALNNYNPDTDSGKLLSSKGSVIIPGYEGRNNIVRNAPLIFVQKPVVTSDLRTVDEPELQKNGSYVTKWSVSDNVEKPVFSDGYNAVRTITFDKLYDTNTFKLDAGSGWVVDKIESQTVTLKRDNFAITQLSSDKWGLGSMNFSINTVINPAIDVNSVVGNVTERIDLQWKKIPSIPETGGSATDTESQTVDSLKGFSQYVDGKDVTREINDPLSWDVNVNMGRIPTADQPWQQEIVLPYNGDIEKMADINKYNKYEVPIDIDPATGLDKNGVYEGIGRSQFNGTYDLSKVTVSDAPSNTQVKFTQKDGKEVTRPVGTNGVVDLTGVDVTQVTKVTVIGVDNTSAIQAAGMRVNIEVMPHGNKEGDDYVLWVNQVTSPAFPKDEPKMAWPAANTVVASEVEGTLWQDADRDGYLDADEKDRFVGVSVTLQKKDASGNWVPVPDTADNKYTTKTDENGKYRFEGLHSGEYQVKLVNVEKDLTNTMDVDTVGGKTGIDAKDGNLPQATKNRFDVTTTTKMTRSYNRINNATNDSVSVPVYKDQTTSRVDYGFIAENADLKLDKSPATVTANDGYSTVEWDVQVKNNGNTVISGATLNDRTSSEVIGVDVSAGYFKYDTSKVTGEYIASVGRAGRPNDGYVVGTTDGVWMQHLDYHSYNEYSNYPVVVEKINDITGTVLNIYGGISPSSSGDAYNNSGFTVETTDGLWLGYFDIEQNKLIINKLSDAVDYVYVSRTRYVSKSNNVLSFFKERDYQGEKYAYDLDFSNNITKVFGFDNDNYDKFGVVITDNNEVWGVTGSYYTAPVKRQLTGFTGEVRDVIFNVSSTTVITSDGLFVYPFGKGYLGDLSKPAVIDSSMYSGDLISVDGNFSSPLLVTTDSVWFIVIRDGGEIATFNKVSGIDGEVLYVRQDISDITIVTKTGVYSANIDINSDFSAKKVSSFSGKVKDFAFDGSQLRIWILTDNNEVYYGRTYGGLTLNKFDVSLIPGTIKQITTQAYGNYVAFFTGEEVWVAVDNYGNGDYSLVFQPEYAMTFSPGRIESSVKTYASAQNLAESRDQITETNSQGRSFINRGYALPDILPGESVTIHMRGTVRDREQDLVVGNQAWVTSPSTPREGITVTTNGQVKTTGVGQTLGTPDLPVLPSADEFNFVGIFDNPTVAVNVNIDYDTAVVDGDYDHPIDDLADQTPALIKGIPNAPALNSSVSGNAWYDTDENGSKSAGDKPIANMKVQAFTKAGVLVGETRTDASGNWSIAGLREGEQLDIHYDVTGHSYDNKFWTPIVAGSTDTATDSDIGADGYVKRDIVVTQTGTAGKADAGLRAIDAGINVTKGAKDGAENAIVRGERSLEEQLAALRSDLVTPPVTNIDQTTGGFDDADNDPRTAAYTYTVSNTGQSAITDVEIADKTVAGNAATFSAKLNYQVDGVMQPGSYSLRQVDGKWIAFNDDANAPLVMARGGSLTANYQVGFTTGNERHENALTSRAAVLDNDGVTKINTVTDTDEFSAQYEQVAPKRLTLHKVDDQARNTEQEKSLAGATITIDRTNFATMEAAINGVNDAQAITGEVGTYRTDKNGNLSVDLPSGIYRVRETAAPKGYVLPDAKSVTHFVHVYYDEKGVAQMEAHTINTAAAGTNDSLVSLDKERAADATTWGQVELDNVVDTEAEVGFRLPETGLAQLALLGAAGLGLLGGFFAWTRINARRKEDDLELS